MFHFNICQNLVLYITINIFISIFRFDRQRIRSTLSVDIPDSTIQIQTEENSKNAAEFEVMLKENKTELSEILFIAHFDLHFKTVIIKIVSMSYKTQMIIILYQNFSSKITRIQQQRNAIQKAKSIHPVFQPHPMVSTQESIFSYNCFGQLLLFQRASQFLPSSAPTCRIARLFNR